ncbi:hypothetical protein [Halocalculus aciditolerans]|uniref:Uncharacterized protein n=1 Tax=Halocalculus aciditolerans TaxID=1383812 RepID=A0A830FHH6_9EURY|nr:hypothetical protein [Halocalculus aciditolerans]GGL47796.1 hypothetical protein GCM10009039_02530 [Halocalculus aciditolerans]
MSEDESTSGNAVSSVERVVGASRYDIVLALVPVFLGVGAWCRAALGSGPWLALGAAASALAVGYALFGDPPRPPRAGRSRPPEH